MRSSTPPPELISSMARSVALSWDCSIADVTPVWENSTPTRHGPSVFSLKLMTLTWTIALAGFERPYVRLAETQIARQRYSAERAVSDRWRHLPATESLLETLGERQRHVLSPRPGSHLDADRQAFRRGANSYRRRRPAGEVMHLRVTEPDPLVVVEAGAMQQRRIGHHGRQQSIVVFHEAQHRIAKQIPSGKRGQGFRRIGHRGRHGNRQRPFEHRRDFIGPDALEKSARSDTAITAADVEIDAAGFGRVGRPAFFDPDPGVGECLGGIAHGGDDLLCRCRDAIIIEIGYFQIA